MSRIKYIFFDCMETIIDLYELPSKSDYAYWAYQNSGVEGYWDGFEDFLKDYEAAKTYFDSTLAVNAEYDMVDRLKYVVDLNNKVKDGLKKEVIVKLNDRFWNTYKSKCYVKKEVSETLERLSKHYKLAVISNFKVKDGIEELLELNHLRHIFDFIVTSINFGWGKPDIKIYQHALNLSNCLPEDIMFIGDDYENDYMIPRQLGMKALLLIKNKQYNTTDYIKSFLELEGKLLE